MSGCIYWHYIYRLPLRYLLFSRRLIIAAAGEMPRRHYALYDITDTLLYLRWPIAAMPMLYASIRQRAMPPCRHMMLRLYIY